MKVPRHLLIGNVRSLLALVTLVALGLRLWSAAAHAQRDAVAGLRALDPDAVIAYDTAYRPGCDFPVPGTPGYVQPGDEPLPWWAPRWAYRWLGPDYFRTVTVVLNCPLEEEADTPANRARLVGQLARLRHLKILDLSIAVDDADVARLAHLTGLKELTLGGLSPGRFPALTDLRIRCRVPGAGGLGLLATMPRLQHLDLSGPSIRDDDLRPLAALGRLGELTIADATLGGTGLRHLVGLTGLGKIHLIRSNIGDATMAAMARLPGLIELNLYQTNVTAGGLERLRAAPRFASLVINPPIPGDPARLAAILPGCDLKRSIKPH